jgi:hypothetical protein
VRRFVDDQIDGAFQNVFKIKPRTKILLGASGASSMSSSLNASHSPVTKTPTVLSTCATATDAGAVLVREAGVPFQPLLVNVDPFTEWLSLMEVVQMLCPAWPVRDRPIMGTQWKL